MQLFGKRALVTGAGGGLGRALASAAADAGARLLLTDRDAKSLADARAQLTAAGADVVIAHPADIADRDQVRALAQMSHAEGGSVDVLLNVAGAAAWGSIEHLVHRHWRSMVEINLMGPIHVLESFVPAMIESGRGGHIVNVSSAAGLIGLPWHAAYSAAKFGIRGVSEVLRFDLRPHGIGVSLVCPGAVRTSMVDTIEIAGVDQTGSAFTRAQRHFRRRAVTPERAAAVILRGVRRDRYLVYTSRDVQAAHLLQRVCPPAYTLLMRLLNVAVRRVLPVTP